MSSVPGQPVVSIVDLTKSFGERTILNSISLEVAAGEIVAIMGASGSGKTTLLRCVSGLIRPTQGSIRVVGIDSQKNADQARKVLGMVFQSAALFDFMTVGDNVRFGLQRGSSLTRDRQATRAKEALALVGLSDAEHLMPSELSGGMKKRVGIARALALEPKVMLYDEPTTGLDPITTYTIDRLIVDLRGRLGMSAMLVSHDVVSVFRVADRIVFLHEGRLIFAGTPAEFKQSREPAIRELIEKSEATSFVAS